MVVLCRIIKSWPNNYAGMSLGFMDYVEARLSFDRTQTGSNSCVRAIYRFFPSTSTDYKMTAPVFMPFLPVYASSGCNLWWRFEVEDEFLRQVVEGRFCLWLLDCVFVDWSLSLLSGRLSTLGLGPELCWLLWQNCSWPELIVNWDLMKGDWRIIGCFL